MQPAGLIRGLQVRLRACEQLVGQGDNVSLNARLGSPEANGVDDEILGACVPTPATLPSSVSF